ncbi:MAG: DNA-binding protein [Ruminococcaceae bacterium]|nr:DNA-binding protein [Oscillospiraceae bacterium]
MFEKNLAISDLLDEYAPVLSARHRLLLDYYYNQDLSLSEIACEIGISRQGVRDGIKKAEEELLFMEQCLHLHQKASDMRDAAQKLLSGADEKTAYAVQAMLRAAGIEPEEEGV